MTFTYRDHLIIVKHHFFGFQATASGPALRRPVTRTGGSLFVEQEVKGFVDRALAKR